MCTCAEERPRLMSSAARRDTFSRHRNWTRREKLLLDCVTSLQQWGWRKNTAARLFLGKTHWWNYLFLCPPCLAAKARPLPQSTSRGAAAAIYTAILLQLVKSQTTEENVSSAFAISLVFCFCLFSSKDPPPISCYSCFWLATYSCFQPVTQSGACREDLYVSHQPETLSCNTQC